MTTTHRAPSSIFASLTGPSSAKRSLRGTWRAGLALSALLLGVGPAHAAGNAQDSTQQNAKPSKAPAKSSKVELKGQLNINTASQDAWELLPGIGPSTAAKIVAHRDATPFEKIEDLVQVRGIGRKTLAKIRGYLKMSGDSDLKEVKAQ